MSIKKNDRARLIQPVVEGVVTRVKFDEDTGVKSILLEWTDGSGHTFDRWFAEGELEITESYVAPPPEPPTDPAPPGPNAEPV